LKSENESFANMLQENIRQLNERISKLIKDDKLLKSEADVVKNENEELR
jgi:hypothetical protein